jgi:hypothetical protein
MSRWIWTCALVFLCVPLAGCNKQTNDQDAIRASIEKRLNGRADLNMSAMDREVKQVSVSGDHATAQVEFRLKGGDARMEIEYTLERQGKEWAVLGSQPMGGGSSHSEGGKSPPNAPDAGGSSRPQGHPPTN